MAKAKDIQYRFNSEIYLRENIHGKKRVGRDRL